MPEVIVGEGGPRDNASILLATKKGQRIKNVRRLEKHPEQMRHAERFALAAGASVRTRSLSSSYNCFGLAFASRRTCVDDDQVPMILADDEYRRLQNRADAMPGDLVLYRKAPAGAFTHVAVVIEPVRDIGRGEVQMRVLSQWGQDGEYMHLPEEVPPWFGTIREYYSERRSP